MKSSTPSLFSQLWRRGDTRLCLVVLALYAVAAAWGEAAYRHARYHDHAPSYNRVNEEQLYRPPAFVRLFQPPPSPPSAFNVTTDAHRTNSTLPSSFILHPSSVSPRSPLSPFAFPLGSDNLGRDVLRRLVQGTRIAFHVGVMTSLIALPLGVLLGCLGGYFGGRTDSFVVWLCATVAAMPSLLLVLAIAIVVGKGLTGIYLGIGLTTWVGVCRNVRAEVIKHRGRTYVQAARVLGYSHARVLVHHILPNVMHIVLISFSIRFPAAVSTEVFISFLGIGVQGEPSWGVMLNNARLRLWQGVWWELTFVTLAIFGLVLVFNVLTDRLRDLLDPATGARQEMLP